MKRYTISLIASIICMASYSQQLEELAINTKYVSHGSADSLVKLFSNSEPKGITFLVSSNLKENSLFIKTNYTGSYNVRLVDYYGRSSIVFKNVTSNIKIDLTEFKPSIFVMNISDDKNSKLISSQVINFKRRLY